MSDDRDGKKEIVGSQQSEGEPVNTAPFVPSSGDTANMIAIQVAQRHQASAAAIVAPQELPPQPLPVLSAGIQGAVGARKKRVQYVDFGFTSAQEFWDEVVLPAYECFKAEPSRGKAIMACFPAWHIQDWIWHDQHPGEDTRNSKDYQPFQEKLFLDCPELQWIRDVADAGKHRGLGRQKPKVEVRGVKGTWPRNATPLTMTLDDGTQHDFADVFERVIEFWRAKYFP